MEMKMLIFIFLLSTLLTALALIAAGVVVLLKSKNKLAGWVVLAVGIAFLLVPVLFITTTILTGTITG
jgi:hypothetical protein